MARVREGCEITKRTVYFMDPDLIMPEADPEQDYPGVLLQYLDFKT